MTTQQEALQTTRAISKMLYTLKHNEAATRALGRGDIALLERANDMFHNVVLDHMEPTPFEPGTKVELVGGTKDYHGIVVRTKAFVEASQGDMVTEGYTVVVWRDGYINSYRTNLLEAV